MGILNEEDGPSHIKRVYPVFDPDNIAASLPKARGISNYYSP